MLFCFFPRLYFPDTGSPEIRNIHSNKSYPQLTFSSRHPVSGRNDIISSMTRRKVPLVSGEYFHIYNRGNSKQPIFLDDEDRDHFVKLLYISNSKRNFCFRDNIVNIKIDAWDFERGTPIVSIGAWVLMPNHFHLYLISQTPGVREMNEEEYNISLFLRKLCVSYSKYFNAKYETLSTEETKTLAAWSNSYELKDYILSKKVQLNMSQNK